MVYAFGNIPRIILTVVYGAEFGHETVSRDENKA